ncbi:MAG: hypothetical protein RH945_00130 [Hyphomonas sp.]
MRFGSGVNLDHSAVIGTDRVQAGAQNRPRVILHERINTSGLTIVV